MKLTTLGWYSTRGVWVTYRIEGTEEFLWRAPQMLLLPIDSKVGHLNNTDEVEKWYKVEGYKAEFDSDLPGEFGDPPQQYVVNQSYFGVVCFVSLVT